MAALPNFEQAQRYALEVLERELSPLLVYHNVYHTREDVLPAVNRLAALEKVTREDFLLLCTAACFHDIGFTKCYRGQKNAGAKLAQEVLPQYGYQPEHIQAITGMILATRVPQSPHTKCEQILADAELDLFGREDFLNKSSALWTESAAFDQRIDEEAWFLQQLEFMQNHQYFTQSARTLWGLQKEKNKQKVRVYLQYFMAKKPK